MRSERKKESNKEAAKDKQKKDVSNNKKRRILWSKPFWFPLRDAQIIVDVYLSGKGMNLTHCPRLLLQHMLERSQKQKVGDRWEVDLQETRWESKASIAKSIGKGLVEYTRKDLENAEAKLRKCKLLKTKMIKAENSNETIGRYFAFSEDAIKIFVLQSKNINPSLTAKTVKINAVESNVVSNQSQLQDSSTSKNASTLTKTGALGLITF